MRPIEPQRAAELWQRGIAQFNRGEFFECHESWEEIWLAAPEPDKTFLQGIIQVAAAFHHYRRGNLAGARSLLSEGLRKIERFPDGYRGIALESLRVTARHWSAAFRSKATATPISLPSLELSGR
jgi:hypothetical protein